MKRLKRDEDNSRSRWLLLCCLTLAAATFLLYSPTLKYDFSRYDDHRIIGEHPQLYSDGSITERLKQIIYLDFPREEPLIVRDLSWLADSAVFGFNRPFGYHYGNVLYHAVTLVLAFLLILRLTTLGTALISALLLLVLAAHVEPVAWIMGRKDVLSAMFSLGCILLFLRFRDNQSRLSSLFLYTASITMAAAAFLSKINAVVLPGILFICALISTEPFIRDGFKTKGIGRTAGALFLQVLPFFVLSLALFLWYRSVVTDYGLFSGTLEYSNDEYKKLILITNPLIFIEYLKIILVPWNLEAYYTTPSIFTDSSGDQIAMAAMVWLATPVGLIFLWRVNRTACLFFLCFIVAMLPYGNWVHFGFWYANRYVYFSSIFLVAGLGSLVIGLFERSGVRFAKMAVTLTLAWFLGQNALYRIYFLDVWRNGETLWKHEIGIAGSSIHDYNNLTAYYLGEAEDSPRGNRGVWLEKAKLVNAETFNLKIPQHDRIWLSVSHYYKGLILAYSEAPLEEQLQEFLKATNSSSGFSRAFLSTGAVYYQLAKQETDPELRLELADSALHYMRMHFASAGNGRGVGQKKREILGTLEREFPELSIPEIEANSLP